MIVTQHFNFHADNFSTDRPTAKLKRNKFFFSKKHKEECENRPRNENHDQSFLQQTFCGVYPLEKEEDDRNYCDYAPGDISEPLLEGQQIIFLGGRDLVNGNLL